MSGSEIRHELDALFARLAGGDRSAVEPAFALARPLVSRFCRAMLPVDADADDAVQTTLMKVFFQAARYDRSHPAAAWLLAVARWECMTIRARSRRARNDGDAALATMRADHDPADDLERAEAKRAVRAALGQLGETDRHAVERAFFEAAVDAAPRSPAERKRKERALDKLRHLLRSIYGD